MARRRIGDHGGSTGSFPRGTGTPRAPGGSAPVPDAIAGFPGIPDAWRAWPTTIEVAFTLTPATCVYQALYDEYARDTLEAAARTLFDPRNAAIFVRYRLHTVGVVPALGWYAGWPLRRRGSPEGIARRGARGGAAPWESEADDTLLELWNEPRGVWGFRRTRMLRVGGRSREEAARNWAAVAAPLRRRLRAAPAGEGGR